MAPPNPDRIQRTFEQRVADHAERLGGTLHRVWLVSHPLRFELFRTTGDVGALYDLKGTPAGAPPILFRERADAIDHLLEDKYGLCFGAIVGIIDVTGDDTLMAVWRDLRRLGNALLHPRMVIAPWRIQYDPMFPQSIRLPSSLGFSSSLLKPEHNPTIVHLSSPP